MQLSAGKLKNKVCYIKRSFCGFIKELRAYSADIFKKCSPEKRRVVIFAQGRTGSTLLEDILCSSGYFSANGELLSKKNSPFQGKILFPKRYVSGLSKMSSKNFIFHVKIHHLLNEQKIDPKQFLESLALDGWKIIFLERDNKVNHVLSNFMANARGGYQKYEKKNETIQLTVDCALFCEKIGRRLHYGILEKKALEGIEYISLSYEKDLEKPDCHQHTANRILNYLSLEPKPIRTKHKKINVKGLGDVIVNYDEFIETIKENGYGHFLENER